MFCCCLNFLGKVWGLCKAKAMCCGDVALCRITVATCYRPTYTAYYGADVQPVGHYASPPRQRAPAGDDWMYGCPQSRTFKVLQSVMHNEGESATEPVIAHSVIMFGPFWPLDDADN